MDSRNVTTLDFGSIASLTRDLVEAVTMFFYLSEDVDDDSWELRKRVLDLHDCVSRIQLFEAQGTTDQAEQFREIATVLRDKLNAAKAFKALSNEFKNKLIKGEMAKVVRTSHILNLIGINLQHYKTMNKFLSAQIHSTPLAWYRMDENQLGLGVGSNSERGYSAMTLEYGRGYLEKACEQILIFFPDIAEGQVPKILD